MSSPAKFARQLEVMIPCVGITAWLQGEENCDFAPRHYLALTSTRECLVLGHAGDRWDSFLSIGGSVGEGWPACYQLAAAFAAQVEKCRESQEGARRRGRRGLNYLKPHNLYRVNDPAGRQTLLKLWFDGVEAWRNQQPKSWELSGFAGCKKEIEVFSWLRKAILK